MNEKYEQIHTNQKFPAMIHYFNFETMKNIPKDYRIEPHWHRSIELSYIQKGNIQLTINNKSTILHANDFIFINSGMIHEIERIDEENCEVMMLILDYHFLKKVCPDFEQYTFNINKSKKALNRFKEIYLSLIQLSTNHHEYDELLINAYIYEIIYLLMNECIEELTDLDLQYLKKQQHILLDYIENHYQENLSLKHLAIICNMSEEHLSRSFLKTFGINYKRYLTQYRLMKGYSDVISTQDSIQDIALHHG
ncbi:MAG: AraC family ligand binding domain-containing protein, partial [Traorella sp.]